LQGQAVQEATVQEVWVYYTYKQVMRVMSQWRWLRYAMCNVQDVGRLWRLQHRPDVKDITVIT